MNDGIRCMWMRGGTSKGGYFLADDLPPDPSERDALLLRIMGSPDPRQIDGMGGATSLTSKIAVVSPSDDPAIDVDYLFLQISLDRALVSDAQTCGNILAGVAPFAIERGLVAATGDITPLTIRNTNTGQIVRAEIRTPGGRVTYRGDETIDGVPGASAPVPLMFSGLAGSKCGALLPSGAAVDTIDGIACTLIDNGMPAVVIRASDLGVTGTERPAELDADTVLKGRLEAIRLRAGPLMNLGDVADQSVPKMCLAGPPLSGGGVNTRCFIPHACHETIGVLCAVSVATACLLESSPAAGVAVMPPGARKSVKVEHPNGQLTLALRCGDDGSVVEAGSVRTARKLFDGIVFP